MICSVSLRLHHLRQLRCESDWCPPIVKAIWTLTYSANLRRSRAPRFSPDVDAKSALLCERL
jgi:hypothetical protein